MLADLSELQQIEALRALKSSQVFGELLREEMRLREALKDLNEYRQQSCPDPMIAHEMRSIGADVAWRKWVDGQTATLNVELAQLLARKEALHKQVQRDVGRREAVAHIVQKARSEQRDNDRKRRETEVLGMAVLSSR